MEEEDTLRAVLGQEESLQGILEEGLSVEKLQNIFCLLKNRTEAKCIYLLRSKT